VVTEYGTSYVYIYSSPFDGQDPSISPLYWSVLASAGPTGSTGPTGHTGPTGPGFKFRGEWEYSTVYSKNDVVTEYGTSYVYIYSSPFDGQDPSISPLYWSVLANAGATGPAGTPYAVSSSYPDSTLGTFSFGSNLDGSFGYSIGSTGTYMVTINWNLTKEDPTMNDMIQLTVYPYNGDSPESTKLYSLMTTDSEGNVADMTLSGLIQVQNAGTTAFNYIFRVLTSTSTTTYTAYLESYVIQRVA
jgi:hypothetical protein